MMKIRDSAASVRPLHGKRPAARKERRASPAHVDLLRSNTVPGAAIRYPRAPLQIAVEGRMPGFTEEQAKSYIIKLLTAMSQAGGSDLFISKDFPPAMKLQGTMQPLTNQKLSGEVARELAYALMNQRQREEFAKELECNFAISVPGVARFRVNVFVQQQNVGMVVRAIANEIPDFAKLGLPETLREIVMTKRGLVLVVGATGSGKSTSLAAMIDHRNRSSAGHIVTVEDPVEFVHQSQQSLITHREVGIDTHSWHNALKNTLRQAPDVILIGEIRDTETMENAIAFAETGHLCLGTLHSNSANQTIDRIINFFPKSVASSCSWICRATCAPSFRSG
jgi:twitching motility protein PilU